MSIHTCNKCGGRIIFRKVDGRAIPIHLNKGCTSENTVSGDASSYFMSNTDYKSFVNPNAHCPECGEAVFYYENSYGSKVFFDELGPPWSLHPCTSKKINKADNYSSVKKSNNEIVNSYKDEMLKSWNPFKIISYTPERSISNEKPITARILGEILYFNKREKVKFKIHHERIIKKFLREGIIYIKGGSRKNKYKLSILVYENEKLTIYNISSIEKFYTGKIIKFDRNTHKQNEKINNKYKLKRKKVIKVEENIIIIDEFYITCPVCEHDIKKGRLDNHLNKHWKKDVNKSISSQLDFKTWKKMKLMTNK